MGNVVSAAAGDFPAVTQPGDVAFVDQCLGRMRMLNSTSDAPRALYDGARVAFLHTASGRWLGTTTHGSLTAADNHSAASQYRVRYVNATRFELLRAKERMSINGCSFFEWVMEPKHHYAEGLAACAVADPNDEARVPLRLSKSSPHRWYTSSAHFAPDDWDRLLTLVAGEAPPPAPAPAPASVPRPTGSFSDRRSTKHAAPKASASKTQHSTAGPASAPTGTPSSAPHQPQPVPGDTPMPLPAATGAVTSTGGSMQMATQQLVPTSTTTSAAVLDIETQAAVSHSASSSTSVSSSATKEVAKKESSVTTSKGASAPEPAAGQPKPRPGDARLFNRWWMFVVFGVFVTLITLGLCTLYTRYGKRETPELVPGGAGGSAAAAGAAASSGGVVVSVQGAKDPATTSK
jgi:hypothetical protein